MPETNWPAPTYEVYRNVLKYWDTKKKKKNFFPFVPNGKFIIFKCPKICANYSLIKIGLNIGIPKNINFLFGANEKSMTLSVPIPKHFRVLIKSLILQNYTMLSLDSAHASRVLSETGFLITHCMIFIRY